MAEQCLECSELSEQITNGFCENCLDNKYRCQKCQEYFDIDDICEVDGENYCINCRDEDFYYCGCCEDWAKTSTTIENGDNICDDCLSEHYYQCSHCGDYGLLDDAIPYYNESLCSCCYGNNFFTCEACGDVYHDEDYTENGYCINCSDNNNDCLHNYNYRPTPIFYGKKSDLYFGIELELENKNGDIEAVVDSLPNSMYAKADNSLDSGLEIVSHPASWKWLEKNKKEWDEILNLRNQGFLSYQTNTCGMHVHLSKKAFGALHLYKFLKLFFENHELILLISRRKQYNLNKWASLETDESLVYKVKKGNDHTKRYTAVNLESNNTVEIRIFRGTLSSTGFWRNLEFCKAVYDYTKNESIKNISAINFCKFVESNQKDYPNLANFLREKYLCA